MKIRIGIIDYILYHNYKYLWLYFFKYLDCKTIKSINSDIEILKNNKNMISNSISFATTSFIENINYLKDECDYIVIPRLISENTSSTIYNQFNYLYNISINILDNNKILTFDINLDSKNPTLLSFLKIGRKLGYSYIFSYKAYESAKKKNLKILSKNKIF